MKKLFLIFLFLSGFINSQNLVPNWSFETYTACPNSSSALSNSTQWYGPTTNSSDYFNSCAPSYSFGVPYQSPVSFQNAKDGNAIAGIWVINSFGLNYREYLEVKLSDSLQNGVCYYGEFYANLHNKVKWACNNLAASFSYTQHTISNMSGYPPLYLPQHIIKYNNTIIKDTGNWVKVSGIYTAFGGEKYITIGNFKDDVNTDTARLCTGSGCYLGSYYYFDAVSVYSINPTGVLPWTYSNTTVAIGDSVYIGNTLGGGFTSNWYTLPGVFIKTGAGIYVKPVTTSTYVVQFTVCGVPRSDTLTVTVTGLGINELGFKSDELRISPNPNNGVFTLEILNDEFRIKDEELRIVNVLGQEIKRYKLQNKKQQVDLQEIDSGIYYLQLLQSGKTILVKKIVKQ